MHDQIDGHSVTFWDYSDAHATPASQIGVFYYFTIIILHTTVRAGKTLELRPDVAQSRKLFAERPISYNAGAPLMPTTLPAGVFRLNVK